MGDHATYYTISGESAERKWPKRTNGLQWCRQFFGTAWGDHHWGTRLGRTYLGTDCANICNVKLRNLRIGFGYVVPLSWQDPVQYHYRDSNFTIAIIAISILSLSTTDNPPTLCKPRGASQRGSPCPQRPCWGWRDLPTECTVRARTDCRPRPLDVAPVWWRKETKMELTAISEVVHTQEYMKWSLLMNS